MAKPKVRFSKLDEIGAADAETDAFLKTCFVDSGYFEKLTDFSDNRNLVVGRTGSGKSALLRHLRETQERVIQIEPDDLSLSYITNTTIIKYLLDLNVRFDLFFKMLWRHVLSVEILRTHFHLSSKEVTERWLFSFKQERRKRNNEAIEYLENWGNKYWEETDYRVKEITDKFAGQLKANIGTDLIGMGANAELSEEKRTEVVSRAQAFVSKIQMHELSKILDLMNDVLDDPQKKYTIVIDKLDENWVEDELRFLLIRALIESSKDFKKVSNVKVVIALREDLLNRVLVKTRDQGFQKEKFESMYLNIQWDKSELENLLDRRIEVLLRKKGSTENHRIREVLPSTINRQEKPIDYILDRTLLRPRDAISYINNIIKRSGNSSTFTAQTIRAAESEYSESRINALADEWFADYPNFSRTLGLLRDRPAHFRATSITKDECETLCLDLLTVEDQSIYKIGKLYRLSNQLLEGKISDIQFRNEYCRILFEIGIIGLKFNNRESVSYHIEERRDLRNPNITDDTRIYIHRAFWRYLNIQEQ